ncbi:methyltransferase, FxLD system [Nonomuraea sp. NN258]|uniref:methyltransferase, FxLD system n=1 Tax=Nonomuraea antri TaxID=2730852 RepID=UPI00156A5894|nr:methyltransferase, FxLD system [Nonomuraea antri]NRQ30666.1 methyltransferase, FxLD system [Nonomuraea antri]
MPTTIWRQYNIAFRDADTAEQVAAHALLPVLALSENMGLIQDWWFVRKTPWRLRCRDLGRPPASLVSLLDTLTQDGRIIGWSLGIYEPETRAFGGEAAMDVAHTLFHHDSLHVLRRLAEPAPPVLGQRETSVVLCGVMLRAAMLDWCEQGDVWAQVAQLRPSAADIVPADQAERLRAEMRRLMTADTTHLCDATRGGPLTGYEPLVTAFADTGRALAGLAAEGQLTRGLRAVLAHHIIFHANRAGLTLRDQIALARLAADTVFLRDDDIVSPLPTTHQITKVNRMTTISDDRSDASGDQLRDDLTKRLLDRQVIRTAAVEAAFRRTPRHLFLPGVDLGQAYANDAVYTKQDQDGVNISAASQPGTVAMMLEQLAAQPGDRIMEAGAGTGYNAALMAAIVGDSGHVTTIDVDDDLVAGAREHLAAAGIGNVEVVLGDGALGHPANAPYQRIIATVGAYEVPPAWMEQLTPGGRLVVPVRLRGTNSRSIAFERNDNCWHSIDSQQTVFMPLRGTGDDARRYIHLTPEQDVTLQVHQDQVVNPIALAGVLDGERHEDWTGVLFPGEVSLEWLELWLCLRLDNALMRMNTAPEAKDRGVVTPMFPWGSMATVSDRDLVYLTIRPVEPDNGRKMYEIGVVGHGPSDTKLMDQVAEEICRWDSDYRDLTARFEIPDQPVPDDPAAGRFVLDREHHQIVVIWD